MDDGHGNSDGGASSLLCDLCKEKPAELLLSCGSRANRALEMAWQVLHPAHVAGCMAAGGLPGVVKFSLMTHRTFCSSTCYGRVAAASSRACSGSVALLLPICSTEIGGLPRVQVPF